MVETEWGRLREVSGSGGSGNRGYGDYDREYQLSINSDRY